DIINTGVFGSEKLINATNIAFNDLIKFASDGNFNTNMDIAFGESRDRVKSVDLFKEFASGNFSSVPKIDIITGLPLNTNGAFDVANNKIYLAKEFVNNSSESEIKAVVLEEIGHSIDFKINKQDAAGDEGDIFSRFVRGESISGEELLRLKAEDDHAVIWIDGQQIAIEKNDTLGTAINLGTPGNACYSYSGWVGTYSDSSGSHYVPNDFYKFQVNSPTKITLDLVNLQSNVDLKLLDSSGNMIYSSTNGGTANEKISAQIGSGSYYIQVYAYSGNSNYNLGLTAMPGRMNPNTDVDGDGKADAIVSNNDFVTVRRSNGTSFLPNERWTDIGYAGQYGSWFADVTGDGRADAIVSNTDGVYVRRSDGTGFLPNEKWT
ncbi:MAG TPA: pre-peptidase C-terminal domain-containing protein, partial [Allocoleopsis sp.]